MTKTVSKDLSGLFRHFPKVPVVITAHAKGKDNAMAVGFHTPISFKPHLYCIAIFPKSFTYQLIVESKEFGVNFLPFEEAELVASVGGCSGREVDKFQRFNIATDKPVKTAVPILQAAYAAYECRLVDDRSYGDHHLLVGEVAAVHFLKESFTPEEIPDLDKINPALLLSNKFYVTTLKETLRRLDPGVYGRR